MLTHLLQSAYSVRSTCLKGEFKMHGLGVILKTVGDGFITGVLGLTGSQALTRSSLACSYPYTNTLGYLCRCPVSKITICSVLFAEIIFCGFSIFTDFAFLNLWMLAIVPCVDV